MGPVKAIDSRHMRNNFSSHASDYDRYASVQKRVVELLSETWPGQICAGEYLLDVGTGTGALAAALLKAEPNPQLVVMDIAHGMTKEAARRIADCVACDGDARSLPFANETFTGVVSSSVYQWVDNLPAAFAEVARILRPGGLFAIALFGEQTLYELRASHRQAVAELCDGKGSHVQNFPTQAEVAEAISRAGLDCQSLVSRMEVEYHVDVPDLLRQLKQIGAGNAAEDRPKGLASRKVMQRMMAIYENLYRSAEGLPASYEVLVAVAQKKKAA